MKLPCKKTWWYSWTFKKSLDLDKWKILCYVQWFCVCINFSVPFWLLLSGVKKIKKQWNEIQDTDTPWTLPRWVFYLLQAFKTEHFRTRAKNVSQSTVIANLSILDIFGSYRYVSATNLRNCSLTLKITCFFAATFIVKTCFYRWMTVLIYCFKSE